MFARDFGFQGDREGRPYNIRTPETTTCIVGATLAVALEEGRAVYTAQHIPDGV